MRKLSKLAIFSSLLIGLLCFSGCVSEVGPELELQYDVNQTILPADPHPQAQLILGFASVIPPYHDLEIAYQRASKTSIMTSLWVGSDSVGTWNLADVLSGEWGETILEDFIRGNGLIPIVNLSFFDKDPITGKLILDQPSPGAYQSLSDPEFREAYLKGALEVLLTAKPRYYSLGNEVNRWYEEYGADPEDPNGFQHFVSLYEEIYHEVKHRSPETEVFCIFAREVVSENREADLAALDFFDPASLDLLVFTTYPFAVEGIDTVANIPDDYYQQAFSRFNVDDLPLGIAETAWSTMNYFGGEAEQATFLKELTNRLTEDQNLNLEFLVWWSLYDLENDPHQSGLIGRDFREKEGFLIWQELGK
jgi:hypothetical protein